MIIKKYVSVPLLSLFLSSLGILTSANKNRVFADECTVEGADYLTSYNINDVVDVKKCSLNYNGVSKQANYKITLPDGTVSLLDRINCSDFGRYHITYSADFDGTTIEKDISFDVQQPSYEIINSKNGNISYGDYCYNQDIKGLNVEIPSGGAFVYKKILDTRKMDGSVPLIKIFPYSTNKGVFDFKTLYIKVEDINDSQNYFQIQITNAGYGPYYCYETVKLNGTAYTGYNWALKDGVLDKVICKGKAGTEVRFAMDGTKQYFTSSTTENDCYKKGYNSFFFNYESKELEVKTEMLHTKPNSYNLVIADLDDPDTFSKPWLGFSSNECVLSITAASYSGGENAKIFIESILGDDLSESYFSDNSSPSINVDLKDYNEDCLPLAEVNKPYQIFECNFVENQSKLRKTSVDVHNSLDLTTPLDVNDNSFIPSSAGDYILRYYCEDYYDNSCTKDIHIKAVDKLIPISFNIDIENSVRNGYVGEKIPLAKCNVNGGSGNIILKTTISLVGTGEIFDISDGYFLPNKAGTYSVSYLAKDYLGNYDLDGYYIKVILLDDNIMATEPELPKYLIDGFNYKLPKITAKNFATGNESTCRIQVEDSNGVKEFTNVFAPKVSNSGDFVTITYIASANYKKEYKIPCYKTEGKKENYFLSNNSTITPTNNSIKFDFNNKFDAEFINSLISDGFEFSFRIPEGKDNFNKLNVFLMDSVNENQQIKITFEKDLQNNALISVNDGLKYKTKTLFTDKIIFFKYDISSKFIKNNANTSIAIDRYLNNSEFNGFNSGKVYLKFGVDETTDNSAVELISINLTQMNNRPIEDMFASITCIDNYKTNYTKDDVIVLPRTIAGLVFDPCVKLELTVTDTNGNVASDINGLRLENADPLTNYSIKANDFGSYMVSYIATDSNSNISFWEYKIKIISYEKPVITINGEVQSYVALNSYFTVPSASINVVGNIYYYYSTPNGDTYQVNSGDKIKAVFEGAYKIQILAVDNSGNMSTASLQVVCGGNK